jgi:transcriptional regulator with XRE-family HTH domain/uncharacterized protein YuzE
MKYFYDRHSDSLYLKLAEAQAYEDSVEAVPGVVLDFDSKGRLLGIDIEHASKRLDVTDLELHEEPTSSEVSGTRVDGLHLKKERERLGLTQSELSRQLDVSANTIARWERGELKIEHPGMLQLALQAIASDTSHAVDRLARSGLIFGRKTAVSGFATVGAKTTKYSASSNTKPAPKPKSGARSYKKR